MTLSKDTLGGLLQAAAEGESRAVHFIESARDETRVDYEELWQRALGVLHHFQQRGLRPGDELILFTNSNEQFVDAFWACILGGIVPVPVAVGISDDHRAKLFRIFETLRRPHLYTEHNLARRLERYGTSHGLVEDSRRLLEKTLVVDDIDDIATPGRLHAPAADDVAFIQFSSGSTSEPKGVVLTHRNVLTNIKAICEGYGHRDDDVALSWMPLTHDMGLIGFHLCMVAVRNDHHIMATSLFVRRPLLWMEKASEKGATLLCSPNFGYKHFLKLFESKGLQDIDLNKVRLIFNGAEPISAGLAARFVKALEPHGLGQNVMFPVYGLAEASLGVTFPEPGAPLRTIRAHRHSLAVGQPWTPAEAGDDDAVEFVLLGTPIRDCRLRLCDDDDRTVDPDHVGHVQIRGGNVTGGYYGYGAAGRDVFADLNWLRTGDLGLIHDGQLVITGRSKDIIFVNGQNYYPHDIEEQALAVEGLELGKVAAAGATSPTAGTDELLLFVLHRGDLESFAGLAKMLRMHINEVTGLEVAHVIPVERIPKTTSGKVQRHKLVEAYLDGEFSEALDRLAGLAASATDGELSEDAFERSLQEICSEIVVDRPVGLDDNLFEIGISSLALAQIHARVEELYPGEMDIADVFDYPSIRELAAFLARKRNAGDTEST
ncbi:MAG: non-ribosomal peptide synthetase [Xanthomonadales bacterium]|jgi:acyl-CoA synthetase (AMP-forming)/AMP-acid ligase II/acyl carrier protein|nr:non-ribosomal peptide synthetase [Xanthomonadales bacterium]